MSQSTTWERESESVYSISLEIYDAHTFHDNNNKDI
jgi:hypothetical protein